MFHFRIGCRYLVGQLKIWKLLLPGLLELETELLDGLFLLVYLGTKTFVDALEYSVIFLSVLSGIFPDDDLIFPDTVFLGISKKVALSA